MELQYERGYLNWIAAAMFYWNRHACANPMKIPHQSTLSYSPLSVTSSSPTFLLLCPFSSYHGWAETPPRRWCWFSQGHRWPWGTQEHSDQCCDTTAPAVCLSSVESYWCGLSAGPCDQLFDLCIQFEPIKSLKKQLKDKCMDERAGLDIYSAFCLNACLPV